MKLQKPKLKTVLKFGTIATLSTIAFFLYTNDRNPPELSEFSFEASPSTPGRYDFSGRITDERGVAKAAFRCLKDDVETMVLDVAMSGANRNQVSFGLISKSPHWAGNWKGTSYDLSFQGQTNLPTGFEPDCMWQVALVDALGNRIVEAVK